MRRFFVSIFYVAIFLALFSSPTFAAPWDGNYTHGGDHGGEDWIIPPNTEIAGEHTNVRVFSVAVGTTATIKAFDGSDYGKLSVSAIGITINGVINGNYKGYPSVSAQQTNGLGPGAGIAGSEYSSGAGHGGLGCDYGYQGGPAYGSLLEPYEMGSSGGSSYYSAGSGAGGAAIKLIAAGTITINGEILTNGQNQINNRSGGGSGGSVYIDTDTLEGNGKIFSKGGDALGFTGGGGSGGRIAIHFNTNNYTGQKSSLGGAGGSDCENGTLVLINDTTNDIYIPQSQHWDANPTHEGSVHNYRDFIIENGTLFLKGYYTNNTDGRGFIFNTRNFNIGLSGAISTTSYGYLGTTLPTTQGAGPGGGFAGGMSSGGGGYGGQGGTSEGSGGLSYGSPTDPTQLGSAGGSSTNSAGSGSGGGSVKIVATGTITVNGPITSNGVIATGNRSGGGSGGSINLQALDIGGSAAITANGGPGQAYSGNGSGGGGRIALIYYNSKTYNGAITANHGGGTSAQNGTIFIAKAPGSPSSLSQYREDGTTLISASGNTSDHTVILKTNLSGYSVGSTLWSQIEIQQNSVSFTNIPNLQSSPIVFSGDTSVSINYSNNVIWHNSSWLKRQKITIDNISSLVASNYPVKITITKDSDMKNDYSDLLFYDQFGNSLNYFIERYDGTTADIYIKAVNIPTNAIYTVYMYYNNQSASHTNDGTQVFEFFDDFNGSSINQGKWIIDSSTGFSVSNGTLTGTDTTGRLRSTSNFSANKAAEFKVNGTGFAADGISMGFFNSVSNNFGFLVHRDTSYYRTDGTWVAIGTPITTSANLLFSFKVPNNTQVNYSIYNMDTSAWVIAPALASNQVSNESVALGKRFDDYAPGQSYNASWDWVRVRSYISPEPSYSLTSEESIFTLSLLDETDYHWQARVCDQSGFCSQWTPFDQSANADFSTLFDTFPPSVNATNIGFSQPTVISNNWTNIKPQINWDPATDNPGGTGIKDYCISLVETDVGSTASITDPCDDNGVLPGDSPYLVVSNFINLNTTSNLTLSTNKRYWFSIKARDSVDNELLGASDGSDYSNLLNFKYDPTPPVNVTSISAVSGSYASVTDFYFSWPTSLALGATDAESGLLGYQYSIGDTGNWHGPLNNSGIGISYLAVGTSQPYTLPSSDSAYIDVGANTIYFRTVDNIGNFSPPSTYRTALISFGGDAPAFPNNSEVTISVVDIDSTRPDNSFNISWPSANAFNGNHIHKYYYMVNTNPPQNYSTITSNSAVYIGTTATSLTGIELPAIHRGSNFIYIVAVDDNRDTQNLLSPNYSPSNSITASFDFNSDLPDPPQNLTVSDSSIKSASLWRASLAWARPAYSGTGTLTFIIQRSLNGTTWSTIDTTNGYAFLDTVTSSQKYYWRVGSYDNSDDSQNNPSFANAVFLTPKGSYTSAPGLSSNPEVSSITTKKAKISWSTDRTADSKISYGTSSDDYYDEEPSNSTHVSSHVINLSNLTPGTKYYYRSKWTDEDGNTGTSDEYTFTTSPSPSIKDITTSDISITSALIKFTTKDAAKVKIYYGKSADFGAVKEVSTSTNESSYTVLLNELSDGTKYYFKINGFDSESAEYDTGITLDFSTLPRPKVSEVKIQQVPNTAQSTLLVTWKSNTEISSIISYYPQSNSSDSRDEVDIKMIKGDHKLLLKGLIPNTNYILTVRGRDIVGNEAISDKFTFTTATDTRPPMIYDLSVEGSNIPPVNSTSQESSSQLVVSWTTDEPSTSQVEYGEGSSETYQQRTQEDSNLTYNHLVIISNLTPSKVYHLRALSKDLASNLNNSLDTVTITPKSIENALNLVITNLSEAFGFLERFKK